MSPAPSKDPAAVETEVREKIHLEILKRTEIGRASCRERVYVLV